MNDYPVPYRLYLTKGVSLGNPATDREFKKTFKNVLPELGCPPHERFLMGDIGLDLKSKIGFHVSLKNCSIAYSYIGDGWGIEDSHVFNSILIDHKITDENGQPILPSFLEGTSHTNTFTVIYGASITNSLIFPGS